MLLGLYYITAKNSALKRFTGLTSNNLTVLTALDELNGPCHFKRLYDVLNAQNTTINLSVLSVLLKRNTEHKLVTRTRVAGNVLYAITLEGKRLLYAYNEELNNIVNARINKLQRHIA